MGRCVDCRPGEAGGRSPSESARTIIEGRGLTMTTGAGGTCSDVEPDTDRSEGEGAKPLIITSFVLRDLESWMRGGARRGEASSEPPKSESESGMRSRSRSRDESFFRC